MQLSKENVIQTIYDAIDEINIFLAEEARLEKSPETLLTGDQGTLDSLGLINFIVEIEGRVQKNFGLELNLIETLDSPDNPMESIKKLAEFIELQ